MFVDNNMNTIDKSSQNIDESIINIHDIKKNFVYSVETLLRFYQPLDIPKNIFKLETVTSKNDIHFYNNSNRNNGTTNQHNIERKYKFWQFNNNQTKSNSSTDISGVFNSSKNLSWRKGNEIIYKQENFNNSSRSHTDKSEKNLHNEVNRTIESKKLNKCDANLLTDLEKDMSSIEKILNNRFNKESLDSEQFIRNKLVMALEERDGKIFNIFPDNKINANESFSGELRASRILNSDANANRSIVNFNNLMEKVSASNLCGNILNNNDPRINNNGIIKNNHIKVSNNMKASDINKSQFNLLNFQSPNKKRTNNQIIQSNVNHDLKLELEILDKQIWLYRESGTSTIYGPYSTRYMSNLWRNYTFTHKTLFTTTSKYIWCPINFYYPEVRTTFTYIPDLDAISEKLTEDSNSNNKLERIKTEDISSIISEINELQLNVENTISPPKLINQLNNQKTKNNENFIIKINSDPSQNLANKFNGKLDDDLQFNLSNNSFTSISDQVNNTFEKKTPDIFFEDKTQSNTKLPWGLSPSDHNKKEAVKFESILKEEEDFAKNKLQNINMKTPDNLENNNAVPKGWRTTPPTNSTDSLPILEIIQESAISQTKYSPEVLSTNIITNNTSNKWKGWGNSSTLNIINNDNINLANDLSLINKQQGFWEICKLDSEQDKHISSELDNIRKDNPKIKEPEINVTESLEKNFVKDKSFETNSWERNLNNKPKNKKKKGKKIDSSLLAFGIRSDRPRNLNYDLD